MMERMAEPAFRREAAELARKLELGGGYLLRGSKSGEWSLWSRRNGFTRPLSKAADNLVREMEARDLLKQRPGGGLMLAKAGARPKVEVAGPDGGIVATERNDTECALDWLRGRRDQAGNSILSEEQFEAADRLRGDYTLANFNQRVTANWDFQNERRGALGSAFHERIPLNDRALAAKGRLFAALSYVGPELSSILFEVCCMASGLEHAERLLGLPRRSGKAILQMALTRLARHYGLLPEEGAGLPLSRLRHWAAPGYRPRIG